MRNRTQDDYYAESLRLVNDIQGYLEKAEYLGWRPIIEGKHIESAYFAYFSRELGCKTILCMRKMKQGMMYKPYAFIDQYTFDINVSDLKKETPL